MSEVAAPPVELHARVEGHGPAVGLLHGLGGDHAVWNDVIPALATEYEVFAVDLRGHGKTPAPAGSTLTFDELMADLDHFLESRHLPNAHVVGLSAGGFLALYWAIHEPARVRSLTLVSSAGHCDNHTRAIGQRWADTYREEGVDAYSLRLLKDLFYPDWIEAHLDFADALREEQKRRDLTSAVQWGLAIRQFDMRGRYGRLKLPTLIIHGMDDQVIDSSHARLLRQSITGAQLRLLAQTGHLVPLERPKETAEAILGFLRTTGAGTPPPPSV
jgi:pimeloyl-ACP methyl ester carboxylesterase